MKVDDTTDEYAIPAGLVVGSLVWATTLHGGSHKKFKGKIIAIRNSWPPLHIKWIEDEHGNKARICLPEIATSYKMGKDVTLI